MGCAWSVIASAMVTIVTTYLTLRAEPGVIVSHESKTSMRYVVYSPKSDWSLLLHCKQDSLQETDEYTHIWKIYQPINIRRNKSKVKIVWCVILNDFYSRKLSLRVNPESLDLRDPMGLPGLV